MNNKCYLGIDPGSKGFLVVQYEGQFEFYALSDYDLYQLSDIISGTRQRYTNVICVMEQIHALYGSSAKATFSFGEIFGKLQALLVANKIPYVLVPPKQWQKEIWTNADMVVNYKKVKVKDKEITKKEVDTKATSIKAAKRLFPNIDFRKSERCKNLDDNKVDATLMSEYARRKNL